MSRSEPAEGPTCCGWMGMSAPSKKPREIMFPRGCIQVKDKKRIVSHRRWSILRILYPRETLFVLARVSYWDFDGITRWTRYEVERRKKKGRNVIRLSCLKKFSKIMVASRSFADIISGMITKCIICSSLKAATSSLGKLETGCASLLLRRLAR